jgi:hypothetical protein
VNAQGNKQIFDFAKGRGWDGAVSGGSLEFDVGGGYTFRDQFTYMSGDADTYGFVPAGGAVTVAALAAVLGRPVTTASGRALASNDFVQTYGHWVVQKDLEALINDLSINKVFGDHDVTVGYYRATWSSDDVWTIGNPLPVHNAQNGEPLDPSISPASIALAGGNAGFLFGLQAGGDARSEALYAADSWQFTDAFRADLGIRREELVLDYVLDSGPGFADGVLDQSTHLKGSETAYTAAVNYALNDDLGFFVRYTDGFLFPHFDDIRENRNTVDEVKQFEGGVKWIAEMFNVYATAFYNENDAFSSTVGGVLPPTAFTTEAYGVEIDGTFRWQGILVTLIGTLQHAEITDSTTPSDVGNQVLRQPEWQFRLSPSYVLELGDVDLTLYLAATLVGDRFGDNANTVKLDSYEKIDLGAIAQFGGKLFVQAHCDNINDSHGITEGDPRNPSAPNGRPIFGRSVVLSVGYDF